MTTSGTIDKTRWQSVVSAGMTRADIIRKRHMIRAAVRHWLDIHGFLEIDAPLLVRGATPDADIQSFAVDGRYLVTSTEYQIKRMIAGGFDRLYTLTQNFRHGDLAVLNNPEFTMLEWARAGASIEEIESDAEQIVLAAANRLGLGSQLAVANRVIDLAVPWRQMSVKQAISDVSGVSVPSFDRDHLQKAAQALQLTVSASIWSDDSALFSTIIASVQTRLGFDKPVFLRDWPAFQTSSAPAKSDGELTERSELIVAGIELTDGFPFALNPEMQARSNDVQLGRRRERQAPAVDVDEHYLAMLRQGLRPGAGMALGFDRLVMLLTGQRALGPVLAFGWDEV